MKNIALSSLIYLGAALLLASCTTIAFEHAQPEAQRALTQIPSELHGVWQNEDTDLLKISTHSIEIEEVKWQLGESVRLKKAEGKYFLSVSEGDGWVVLVGEVDQTDLRVRMFSAAQGSFEALNRITRATVYYNEEGEVEWFHIDPTPAEFDVLMKSEFLDEEVLYQRIDNRVMD